MRIAIILISFLFFLSFKQISNEILEFKSSTINNLPSSTTKKNLIKALGNPSKIIKYDSTSCAVTSEQENAKTLEWYFYDSTRFLIYDNKADLVEINFRNGKYVYKTSKIIFTNQTTLKQIAKVYPASTKAAIKENGGSMIRIKPCKDCDGYCLLFFENNKLVRLEWWQDC